MLITLSSFGHDLSSKQEKVLQCDVGPKSLYFDHDNDEEQSCTASIQNVSIAPVPIV